MVNARIERRCLEPKTLAFNGIHASTRDPPQSGAGDADSALCPTCRGGRADGGRSGADERGKRSWGGDAP